MLYTQCHSYECFTDFFKFFCMCIMVITVIVLLGSKNTVSAFKKVTAVALPSEFTPAVHPSFKWHTSQWQGDNFFLLYKFTVLCCLDIVQVPLPEVITNRTLVLHKQKLPIMVLVLVLSHINSESCAQLWFFIWMITEIIGHTLKDYTVMRNVFLFTENVLPRLFLSLNVGK